MLTRTEGKQLRFHMITIEDSKIWYRKIIFCVSWSGI